MDGYVHEEIREHIITKTFTVVTSERAGLFPLLYFDVFEFLQ